MQQQVWACKHIDNFFLAFFISSLPLSYASFFPISSCCVSVVLNIISLNLPTPSPIFLLLFLFHFLLPFPFPFPSLILSLNYNILEELRDALSIRLSKKYDIQAFVSCKIDASRYEDPDSESGISVLLKDILGHLYSIIGPHFS